MTELDYKRSMGEKVWERDGHACTVCGKSATQVAHIIPDQQWLKQKYGWGVIHHMTNRTCVCSLECNKMVEVSGKSRPREVEKLALSIIALILQATTEAIISSTANNKETINELSEYCL